MHEVSSVELNGWHHYKLVCISECVWWMRATSVDRHSALLAIIRGQWSRGSFCHNNLESPLFTHCDVGRDMSMSQSWGSLIIKPLNIFLLNINIFDSLKVRNSIGRIGQNTLTYRNVMLLPTSRVFHFALRIQFPALVTLIQYSLSQFFDVDYYND